MAVPEEILRLVPPAPERPGPPWSTRGREVVQLSVRVPADLRTAVHDAAGRSGLTLTDFVERALEAAVDRATRPSGELASILGRLVQQRLADALRDGSYEAEVRAIVSADPDLS